jgi:aminoglycoside 6'-N-acetyltransferase I
VAVEKARSVNDLSQAQVEKCGSSGLEDWGALRRALWPHEPAQDLLRQAEALLARPDRAVAFLARAPDGAAVGFAEATLRHEYVNGCSTSPVAFLEGLYVRESWRRRGAARRLTEAVERWALDLGCAELGSDTYLDYVESQQMHAALGFEEMERVVCYRKRISAMRG